MIRLKRLLFPLLGALLVAVPFFRILFYSDRALLFRDLARDLLAQKVIWASSMRAGDGIPLWNHFAFGGTPFYTMIVGSPLHPLNAIFLLFPPGDEAKALSIFLWIHYLLFYVGAYLLLRAFRCRPPLAALMAASFTLSGYLLSAHSLGHLLAASVAVPWYFYFQERFLRSARFVYLVLASAALAWPIYAGDPQFSYMLALLSGVFFLKQRKWKEWLLLGFLAVLASAAQLLPTAVEVMKSQRLSIDAGELLSFSFHPIRFLELFFPLFFGNRYGGADYWGGQYVNFIYKNPFIFSIYPGILSLLALLLVPVFVRRWSLQKSLLALSVPAGFLLSQGAFSAIPLYELLARFVPFFGFFRYPERFLFWPLLALWLLAALALERILRAPKMLKSTLAIALPVLFLAGSATALLADKFSYISMESVANESVLRAFLKFGLFFIVLQLVLLLPKPKRALLLVFTLAMLGDLLLDQSKLVWDQSKHIAQGRRYRIITDIQADLKKREDAISRGAAFRLATEKFSKFLFSPGTMDHTTSTSFGAFENLIPNTAGIFGIEDTAGYFSFMAEDRVSFWRAVVRNPVPGTADIRFYHDLMGAHYVPVRDADQQVVLAVNDSALPYLYVPNSVFLRNSFESSLNALRDPEFRTNRDAVLEPAPEGRRRQNGERGNFLIKKRDGREITFEYRPLYAGEKRVLVLSEGFDEHWKAYEGVKRLPVFRANGWALGTELDQVTEGRAVEISFRYENPYIRWGIALTVLWFFMASAMCLYTQEKKRV